MNLPEVKYRTTTYQVKRIRKESAIAYKGLVIYLKEIYNGSGKNIIATAFLYNGKKEIDKRYYSVENRQSAIDDLMRVADGKTPCEHDKQAPYEPIYFDKLHGTYKGHVVSK